MVLPSGLHANCSMPPNGFIGDSYGVPSRMSIILLTTSDLPLLSMSAINGCGAVSVHSSQCLYIRSSITLPDASGRSGCLSSVLATVFTCAIRIILLPCGDSKNPSITCSKPSMQISCLLVFLFRFFR